MSTVHRRDMTPKDERCCPSPDCPIKAKCARFASPLPQGIGVTMANYGDQVTGAPGQYICKKYLSLMVSDAEVAAEAAEKKAAEKAAAKKQAAKK